ncbi:hypothetical protein [Nisaea sp.]|uniref:hypothetical protein n=1 Tax=Nisaea sp. TaxID=2024842 RepID=UPI002B2775DE|nr:hypothetical protein [Nisaea sp.]
MSGIETSSDRISRPAIPVRVHEVSPPIDKDMLTLAIRIPIPKDGMLYISGIYMPNADIAIIEVVPGSIFKERRPSGR